MGSRTRSTVVMEQRTDYWMTKSCITYSKIYESCVKGCDITNVNAADTLIDGSD